MCTQVLPSGEYLRIIRLSCGVNFAYPGLVCIGARSQIHDFLNMKQEYRLVNHRIRVVEAINNIKIRFLKMSVKDILIEAWAGL